LETFFSAVCSKGGYNDNPTCQQFQAAYKYLLAHNSTVGSVRGNCSILENTNTLAVNKTKSLNEQNFSCALLSEKHIKDHVYFINVHHLNPYIEDITIYILGFVTMKANKKINFTLVEHI
jgi:hypothetical protein